MNRPTSTLDLRPSELAFVAAMRQLRFGRFESLRIERGERVLDRWPTIVRAVKFGSEDAATPPDEFQLKRQVIELFEHVRAVDAGEIRCLEVRHGLPFSMEVELGSAQIAEMAVADITLSQALNLGRNPYLLRAAQPGGQSEAK